MMCRIYHLSWIVVIIANTTFAQPITVPKDCASHTKVSFFGDVHLSKERVILSKQMFKHIEPSLRWSHENVVNLETVISDNEAREFPDAPFALKSDPGTPSILKHFNIRYLTRANNHSMDFGLKGMLDTSRALDEAKLNYAGVGISIQEASKPMWIKRDGITIALFSYTSTLPREAWATEKKPGVAYPLPEALSEDIAAAKKNADYVVVIFHWGQELNPKPHLYQQELARLSIKSGADLVLGHHAHIAQSIETYEGKTIAYGLGNFFFSSYSEEASFGLGAHAVFCKSKDQQRSLKVAFTPLFTHNGQNEFMTRPMSKQQFLQYSDAYAKERLFDPAAIFYIEEEQRAKSFQDWINHK